MKREEERGRERKIEKERERERKREEERGSEGKRERGNKIHISFQFSSSLLSQISTFS
jgi:hypothetical protein